MIIGMTHLLVLARFDDHAAAAAAARALHAHGIDREHLSVVARNHGEAGALAEEFDGTPGADIEDSRAAARLGELGGVLLAAVATVMPGIGSIVSAGPLSAGLGEAAGHVAGGVADVLRRAGVPAGRADALEAAVQRGEFILGVHTRESEIEVVRATLASSGALDVDIARWAGGQ